MKNTILFCALCMLMVLTSCSKGVKGDGRIISQEIAVENYNEIVLEGNVNLIYEAKPSDSTYFKIETDSNIIPLLEIKSSNNTLSIKQTKGATPTTSINIYTNSPSLKGLNAGGLANISLKGAIAGDDFKLSLRGSMKLNADNLVFASSFLEIEGNADVLLRGQIDMSKMKVNGNVNIAAFGLKVNKLDCVLNGNSNLDVDVAEELMIKISGNAKVVYDGKPEIKKQSITGNAILNAK